MQAQLLSIAVGLDFLRTRRDVESPSRFRVHRQGPGKQEVCDIGERSLHKSHQRVRETTAMVMKLKCKLLMISIPQNSHQESQASKNPSIKEGIVGATRAP